MANCKCFGCMNDFDNSVSSICPHCGYDQNSEKEKPYHLDPGYLLEDRYIIGKVLGSGGFGVTYLAWDTVLANKVAVKEYFPSEFATRMMGTTEVCSFDGEKSYQFEAGLKSFVDEALRLAKLNKMDGIVHIYDSFVDNCTAYIIMEYVEGTTLMQLLKKNGPLPYQQVIQYILPVLNALDAVHQEGIIHRDIAPDNIKVDGDKVTLLDFGAARSATTVHSKSLSVIVKPGYAPEEQYRSHGKQGPWTDIYALAAVMYHLITGKLPEESVERNIKDDLKTPTELGFTLPVPLENAIMNALNVKAEYRIQSAKEFAEALSGVIELERVVVKQENLDEGKWTKKTKITSAIAAGIALILIVAIVLTANNIVSFSAVGESFPNLLGANEKETQNLLKDVGLKKSNYKIIGILKDVDGKAGTIVWQSIEPGERIEDDNLIVDLKMAEAEVIKEDKESDKAVMPNLSAMTQSDAIAALEAAGFTNFSFATKINNSFEEGLVCDQSLEASKKVDKDKAIVVYLAENTEEETTTEKNNDEEEKTTKKNEEKTTKKEKEEKTTKKQKQDKDKNKNEETTKFSININIPGFDKEEEEEEPAIPETETQRPQNNLDDEDVDVPERTTRATTKAPTTQATTRAPANQAPSKAPTTQATTKAPTTQAPTTTEPTTKETVAVPYISGMHISEGTAALSAAGLVYVTARVPTTDPEKADIIAYTNPSGGAMVSPGSVVTITFYHYTGE